MSVSTVLTIYLGTMGSGKSLEMTKNWIVPALKAGYTVASSVKGLNPQALSKYLGFDVTSKVILLPEDPQELLLPKYWPTATENAIIPRGCALCLDEVYKLLGSKPPDYVLEYFREQRHMTDSDGRTGITALAFQHWSDVHRSIRGVADRMYHMSKFYALAPAMKFLRPFGLGFDYRVAVYTVIKDPERAKPMTIKNCRYDPKIFPLYKSHDSQDAAEFAGDGRSSLFASKYITLFIPVMLALAYYGGSSLYARFGGGFAKPATATESVPVPASKPGTATPAYSSTGTVPLVQKSSSEFDSNLSSTYRYVGRYNYGALPLYVLQHSSGYYRYVGQAELKRVVFAGPATQLELYDGTKITSFTGSNAQQQNQASQPGPGTLAHTAGTPPKL